MKMAGLLMTLSLFLAQAAHATCPNLSGDFSGQFKGKKTTMRIHQIPNDCSRIYLASADDNGEFKGSWLDIPGKETRQEFSDRDYYSNYYFGENSLVLKSRTQMKKVGVCIHPETKLRTVMWCPTEVIESSEVVFRVEGDKMYGKTIRVVEGVETIEEAPAFERVR